MLSLGSIQTSSQHTSGFSLAPTDFLLSLLRRAELECEFASLNGQVQSLSARRNWGLASTPQVQGSETTAEEERPGKLREIVQLFQGVREQRARYQQLLYYGQMLQPLAQEFCIPENKVQWCVSQVWVVCKLAEDDRKYFETNSDLALTKGLAALLVEGLNGVMVVLVPFSDIPARPELNLPAQTRLVQSCLNARLRSYLFRLPFRGFQLCSKALSLVFFTILARRLYVLQVQNSLPVGVLASLVARVLVPAFKSSLSCKDFGAKVLERGFEKFLVVKNLELVFKSSLRTVSRVCARLVRGLCPTSE